MTSSHLQYVVTANLGDNTASNDFQIIRPHITTIRFTIHLARPTSLLWSYTQRSSQATFTRKKKQAWFWLSKQVQKASSFEILVVDCLSEEPVQKKS